MIQVNDFVRFHGNTDDGVCLATRDAPAIVRMIDGDRAAVEFMAAGWSLGRMVDAGDEQILPLENLIPAKPYGGQI